MRTRLPGEKFDLAIFGSSDSGQVLLGRWMDGFDNVPWTIPEMQTVVDADAAIRSATLAKRGGYFGFALGMIVVAMAALIFREFPPVFTKNTSALLSIGGLVLGGAVGATLGWWHQRRKPEKIRARFNSENPGLAEMI